MVHLRRETGTIPPALVLINNRIMDYYDREIIRILQRNARTPYTHIARELNVSEGMIRQRVQNLINHGVIRRFTIETGEMR